MTPRKLAALLLPFLLFGLSVVAQAPVNTGTLGEMQWRSIGPLRAGRTRAAVGVPSQPNVFYIGAVNGGVWKTNDFGRTWHPIFDDQPTGSIGYIVVSPSDPNVIYVGSGEGLHRPDLSVGDGIYKSTDAGKTWTHLGLRDGQQISQMAVDPHDPNKLFVAVAGHPYGPNKERGVYRSTDGGQTFQPVLQKDENVGAAGIAIDPTDSNVVYATLWEAREGPWENAAWNGKNGGIYKSTDGGQNWQQLSGGLPAGIVEAYVCVGTSNPRRLFASVATGENVDLYRSDDAGATWTIATNDPRPRGRIGGGDLPVPAVDPKNPDVIYMTSTVTWKSVDGGKTWTGFRGAPGGDDYQNIWINPNDPNIILIASDQGAIITVNGGESWSSWYNQSTAQMYHVAADNAFPYRVCGGQQESGSACVWSRGNDGEITFREWHPVAVEEYGYVAPDPLDPEIVYGGKLTRYNRRTTTAQNVAPVIGRPPDYRVVRTEPVLFSPVDPHLMFFAANTLWSTRDSGQTWKQISPDLTRKTWEVPGSVGIFKSEKSAEPSQRGVIYAVAPSFKDVKLIWAGTDDGLIWLTTDGGANWKNVTPPELIPWQKVSVIEASHHDPQTAYAAINTLRLDDLRPYIYRTRDSGKTWTKITSGIPDNENVNAVREDIQRKGLLFAGTERAVYVSFDEGDHWQSLRLNMPATSVRDLAIKDDDLLAGTHGRGFWILDDITPLRQLDEKATSANAYLFAPQTAMRVRWNTNSDTPLPPDVASAQNPPDGAIIDYYLKADVSDPVTLEILDSSGKVVRKYASNDPAPPPDPELAIPAYWLRPPMLLSSKAGFHRFLWDIHLSPVSGIQPQYPIAAVYKNTAPAATSPWAMPGKYTVVLTVGGQRYTRDLTLVMDPRVQTSVAGLQKQFELSNRLYEQLLQVQPSVDGATKLRDQLKEQSEKAKGTPQAAAVEALSQKLNELLGAGGRFRRGPQVETLNGVQGSLFMLLYTLQETDLPPTPAQTNAAPALEKSAAAVVQRWKQMQASDIPQLKSQLGIREFPPISGRASEAGGVMVNRDEE